jgi:predicted esterase
MGGGSAIGALNGPRFMPPFGCRQDRTGQPMLSAGSFVRVTGLTNAQQYAAVALRVCSFIFTRAGTTAASLLFCSRRLQHPTAGLQPPPRSVFLCASPNLRTWPVRLVSPPPPQRTHTLIDAAGKEISVSRKNLLPCLRRPVPHHAFADLGFPHCCFAHSNDGWDEHALLLLHGLGDTDDNFAKFGAKLQLPQTAVVAVRAPLPLLDMGFTWFDVITPAGNVCLDSPDAVASLRETSSALIALLHRLQQRYNYPLRNIFLLGYSQGGAVALTVLHALCNTTIGGIISISGPPPPPPPQPIQHNDTPVLFTLGARDAAFASKSRAWALFEAQWREARASAPHASDHCCSMLIVADKADAMVQGEQETRALMQFFGRHLRLRSLQLCVGAAAAAAFGCRVTLMQVCAG